MTSDYQREQIETLIMVRRHLATLPDTEIRKLHALIQDYLLFRKDTRNFLASYFDGICNRKCYQTGLSACCSKEGIITHFSDIVINCLQSEISETKKLLKILEKPNQGTKCVYLGPHGCLWQLKPIVCEMFLCESAQRQVFADHPETKTLLEKMHQRKKTFTWPDQPVLFDRLETYFLDAGLVSPLMYLHNSPGLLNVKKAAGIQSRYQLVTQQKRKTIRKN